MANTIDEYITLSVSDLRRLGYIKRHEIKGGRVTWKRGDTITAQIYVTIDTRAVPMCYLSYRYGGTPVQETIRLMFKHSNLNPEGDHGYYYFVCPVSGVCCRKLYNVNGRFVGRAAFKSLYPQQALSRKQRNEYKLFGLWVKLDELQQSRRRKDFYRGKPTPYRLKWEKYIERNATIDPVFKRFQELLQTER